MTSRTSINSLRLASHADVLTHSSRGEDLIERKFLNFIPNLMTSNKLSSEFKTL